MYMVATGGRGVPFCEACVHGDGRLESGDEGPQQRCKLSVPLLPSLSTGQSVSPVGRAEAATALLRLRSMSAHRSGGGGCESQATSCLFPWEILKPPETNDVAEARFHGWVVVKLQPSPSPQLSETTCHGPIASSRIPHQKKSPVKGSQLVSSPWEIHPPIHPSLPPPLPMRDGTDDAFFSSTASPLLPREGFFSPFPFPLTIPTIQSVS